jgi:type II secretory pathway component PulF
MPVYAYNARDRTGQRVAGSANADSEGQLAQALQQQGLVLVSARLAAQERSLRRGPGRVPHGELVAFCYQVQTITAAGVPILTGLEALVEQNSSPQLRAVLRQLVEDVKQGASLSEALDRAHKAFPRLLVSLVRAGEATGRLDLAMGRAGDYLTWWGETRTALLQATIYPAILLTAVAGLVVLLLTFLVPRVTTLFVRTHAAIPLPTAILMAVAGFLRAHIIAVGVAVVAAVVGLVVFRRTARGRYTLDKIKLRVPLVGTLVRKICAARFTNTLAVLQHAGVGVVDALEIAGQTMGNAVMARAVVRAREEVKQGRTISEALTATGEFQPLVTRMLAVGEQTGSLDTTMERVNEFYNREVTHGVKSLLTVLEPTMIALAGGTVGFILLCCFLPLFQLLNVLRQR